MTTTKFYITNNFNPQKGIDKLPVKYYVGYRKRPNPQVSESVLHSHPSAGYGIVFRSSVTPTAENHPANIAFCFGPYRTANRALEVGMYQGYELYPPNSGMKSWLWNGDQDGELV